MVTVRALERIKVLSDHAPLLLSFGSPPQKSMNELVAKRLSYDGAIEVYDP